MVASESKVIGTWWTHSLKQGMALGYVMVEGVDGKRKVYSGTYQGESLTDDVQDIIKSWGAPLRARTLIEMTKKLIETDNFE